MIGFYVHHAGNGHLGRVRSIIAALGTEATVLSSLAAPPDWSAGTAWVQLPRDDGHDAPRDAEAGGVLHWAPLGHAGLRDRMGMIAAWVTRHRPAAFYVDVSVEVAAASLASPRAVGEKPARVRASASTADARSARGTMRLTSPIS